MTTDSTQQQVHTMYDSLTLYASEVLKLIPVVKNNRGLKLFKDWSSYPGAVAWIVICYRQCKFLCNMSMREFSKKIGLSDFNYLVRFNNGNTVEDRKWPKLLDEIKICDNIFKNGLPSVVSLFQEKEKITNRDADSDINHKPTVINWTTDQAGNIIISYQLILKHGSAEHTQFIQQTDRTF